MAPRSLLCLSFSALALLSSSIGALAGSLTASTTCDDTCKQLALKVSAWEASQHASPNLSFYTVLSNYSSTLAPGSVLKLEDATDLTNYTVPSSLTMSRLIYTTTDMNGTVIPASAYVLWPYSPMNVSLNGRDTAHPLVAFAHGTTGVNAPCAPSNYRSLQFHFQVPYALALQGYIVVAPDYAGLGVSKLPNGTAVNHAWSAAPAAANDMANAITAARAAFPDLLRADGPVVAMGHSQGGAAAWAFAERQVQNSTPGYRGTVAISPPTDLLSPYEQAIANTSLPWAGAYLSIQPMLMWAVKAVYPAFDLTKAMTPKGWDQFFNVQQAVQGCLPTRNALPVSGAFYPNWTESYYAQEFFNRSRVGGHKFRGPLLVLSGQEDHIISIASQAQSVKDTCALGLNEHLEFVQHAGMDHFPVIQASHQRWMSWIKDRVQGAETLPRGCHQEVVGGIRQASSVQSLFPNFLVTQGDPGASWEYSM